MNIKDVVKLSTKEQYKIACRFYRCTLRGDKNGMEEFGGRVVIFYLDGAPKLAAKALYQERLDARGKYWYNPQ